MMRRYALIEFKEDVYGLYRNKKVLAFTKGKRELWLMRDNKQYSMIKRLVLFEQNYTCQKCKLVKTKDNNVKLNVHHIIPVSIKPELCYDKNNCIVLCENCHKGEHHKGWSKKDYGVEKSVFEW